MKNSILTLLLGIWSILPSMGQVCLQRADPLLIQYDSSSVQLYWYPGSFSMGVQLEYGPRNYIPGNGALVLPNADTITLGNLQPGQAYDIYLRDSCGSGSVSNWSDALHVKLPSDTILDSLGLQQFITANTPDPWGNGGFNYGEWFFPYPGITASVAHPQIPIGPANNVYDHSLSGSGYAHTRASSLQGRNWLSTPYFSISNLQNPYLQFWVFRNDSLTNPTDYALKVWVESDGQQTQLLSYAANSRFWQTLGSQLSGLTSDTVRIIFEYNRGNSTGLLADILLDDIEVVEAPSCEKPNLKEISNLTSNHATIIAQASNGMGKMMKFAVNGSPSPLFIKRTSTNDTFDLTGGLPPSTQFIFYLKDSCGIGNTSPWSGPWFFSTDCGIVTAPYFYPFADNTGLLYCWNRYGTNSGSLWQTGPDVFAPAQSADFEKDHTVYGPTGFYMAAKFGFSPEVMNLELPELDVSGLTNPALSFYLFSLNDQHYPDTIGNNTLFVDIKDGNGNWSAIYEFRGNDTNWMYHQVPLSSYGDTLSLRFRAKCSGNLNGIYNDLLLDDVRFDEMPTCQRPDSLFVTNLGDSTATLHWSSGSSNNYSIEYQEAEFKHPTGIKTVVAGDSLKLNSLKTNTSYKFYVRGICGTDTSEYSFGYLFHTNCAPSGNFPFMEGFEQEIADSQSLANCWTITKENGLSWKVGLGVTTANSVGLPNTGPITDHSGVYLAKYLYVNSIEGDPGDSTSLQTETFDLEGYNHPELSFWYHMYGSTMGTLKVKLDTGNVFEVLNLQGQQQASDSDPWNQAVIDLSQYNLSSVSIIFTGVKISGNNSEMSIDDFAILDSCFYDTASAAFLTTLDNITFSSFTYAFSAIDSSASRYLWKFGDGSSDSASGPYVTHTYSKDSIYTVRLISINDCSATTDTITDTLIVEGIGLPNFNTNSQKVSVFPNPFSNSVTIDISEIKHPPGTLSFKITDVNGKTVFSGSLKNYRQPIHLDGLSKGLYFLRLDLNSELVITKILKE